MYRPADLETLYTIDQACFPKSIAYGRKELKTYVQSAGSYCLLAEIADEVVGFIVTERAAPWGHIITLDVLEGFRRQSIGSMLLTASELDAASQGANRIVLETATTNNAAIAFWNKHGYREFGTIQNYYGPGLDAFQMSKLVVSRTGAGSTSP
jgi:[ribosomal protein S18]-alanine N-acetyltransferase